MEFDIFPRELQEEGVAEGNIYFVEEGSSFGISGHMHVCIKRNGRVLLFSTCSSKIATAQTLSMIKGWDINTFPVFFSDVTTNQFKEPQTYVNCNKCYAISVSDFVDLIDKGEVRLLPGKFSEEELKLVTKGILLSSQIPREIKELFK